jgi:hypothetical protein
LAYPAARFLYSILKERKSYDIVGRRGIEPRLPG